MIEIANVTLSQLNTRTVYLRAKDHSSAPVPIDTDKLSAPSGNASVSSSPPSLQPPEILAKHLPETPMKILPEAPKKVRISNFFEILFIFVASNYTTPTTNTRSFSRFFFSPFDSIQMIGNGMAFFLIQKNKGIYKASSVTELQQLYRMVVRYCQQNNSEPWGNQSVQNVRRTWHSYNVTLFQ